MLVVVPYARYSWQLRAVRLSLSLDGVEPRYERMTTPDSYFELMQKLWKNAEPFIVIEHDVVVHPGAVQELENCKNDWCTFPYLCCLGWIEDGLGCTHFSSAIIKATPNLFDDPSGLCSCFGHHSTNYCGLDRLIAHRLIDRGYQPHVHAPAVVNLNERIEKWNT